MLAVTPANPLSLGQERLWFLHELNPDDASYNICVTERLVGDLDVAALERALNTVARRHEVLRTRYPAVDGEPVAVVDDRFLPLERVDTGLEELTNRPFDLAHGPVVRAYLTADQTLVIVLHHIAGDGWSLGLLYEEIATLYAGGDLPDLPMQYGDHAREQRRRPVDTSFWRDTLDRVPVLDLPADLPRPRVRTSNGAVVTRKLPKELTDQVNALSRKERVTLFMLLMAAFQTQLHRYTGASDFAVGTPVAARPDEDTEKLIGFFLNTVVLRADLAEDPTFREVLKRTRRTAIDAFTHADTPFDRVVQDLGVARDLSRTPVFQTQFSMRSEAGTRFHLPGLVAEPVDPDFHQAKFDLSLEITPTAEGLDAFFVYSADLFHHETIERFAANFETLLRSIVDDPGQPISRLGLISPDEQSLLGTWSSAEHAETPEKETLAEVISHTSPERVAIRHGDDAISYRKLHRRVAGTARKLRNRGVGPGVRVAVCMEQSIDLAIALLAVLKAGGAYVPIDPEYPEERRAFMLADSGAALLLTEIDDAEADDLEPLGTADDLAYVIYTSGSTGKPKGVAVENREILRYLADARQRFAVEEQAEYALLQSLAFDFGITILYLCLSTGGTLHLLPARISGPELAAHMRGIDYIKLTPSHLGALAADIDDVGDLLPRKLLIFGGEGSSWDFARDLARRVPVVNHYGPTEAIVGVSTHRVSPDVTPTGPITPIGKPLGHSSLYVLDRHLASVPAGVAGELCIGGRLAREYLGRPELTAEKFVEHPVHGRLYRSGDLARWLPTGDLEFLGRRDLQVKIRGYRVELGEIDEALRVLPGISHAVTDAREGELVGYVVADPRPTVGDLRKYLGERLPEYMVPTRWVFLDELPLKGHGKVDRAALPAPEDARPDSDAPFEPPADAVEEAIATAWCEVLGLQQVGVLDDFFDLGGHSLLATRVVAKLRRTLPEGSSPIALMDLFQHPTIRDLATVARSAGGPRPLLYRLTGKGTKAVVCLPYGGGSAVVYQPLADALPPEWELWSVAVPGHDLGLAEESQPLEVVAQRCVEEILRIEAPLTLYGHCGVGGALTVEIARRLEAAGRAIDTVFLGGIFPFARPTKGVLGRWAKLARLERFRSDKGQLNWLTALGADLSDLDDAQKAFVIGNMRHDARAAEDYFTTLMDSGAPKLKAPIVSVVGEYDPATDYYEERFAEWGFIAEQTRLVVLDEAGHYFLKYRPDELAEIVTTLPAETAGTAETTGTAEGASDPDLASRADAGPAEPPASGSAGSTPTALSKAGPTPADSSKTDSSKAGSSKAGSTGASSSKASSSTAGSAASSSPAFNSAASSSANGRPPTGRSSKTALSKPAPSVTRFLLIAFGQMVCLAGSTLTEFALPLWVYLQHQSMTQLAILQVLAVIPGVLAAPLAGAIVDRSSKRAVMIGGNAAALAVQSATGILVWTGNLHVWTLYILLPILSVALTTQRLAFTAAVPQLVPKRYLGHANGIAQMALGMAQFVAPLAAVGLMSVWGLSGILVLDVVGHVFTIAVLALVAFPAAMAFKRRETVGREIAEGFRISFGNPYFRAMVIFFAFLSLGLSPVFMMYSPLVLEFGTIQDAGVIALAAGSGAVAGGLTMGLWGGPSRRRMRGMLFLTLIIAVSCGVVALRDDLTLIGVGAFGVSFGLALVNGVYTTIIQVKVPQRFHGRVFALNQMVAWSTIPIGVGIIAPVGTELLGDVSLMYAVFAGFILLVAVGALLTKRLARFDDAVPDATPDDLVGLERKVSNEGKTGRTGVGVV